MRRNERPLRRKNPGGGVVFTARYTNRAGQRVRAPKPATFTKEGPCRRPLDDGTCCAQHRIWWAYDQEDNAPRSEGRTIGDYAAVWLERHPRSRRTNASHEGRLRAVLGLDLGDGPLRDMLFADVERSHSVPLVQALLVDQERALTGARAVIDTFNAMWTDALDDGWARTASPWQRIRIRESDPRIVKQSREPRVLSWETMRSIAAAAGEREPMIRLLSDCGLRVGELYPLHRSDVKLGERCDEEDCAVLGPHVHVRRRADGSEVLAGTKNERGRSVKGRVAPLTLPLARMLGRVPVNATPFLFVNGAGHMWVDSVWRRTVWERATRAAGHVGVNPHDFRHTWVSRLRAAMVNAADLAFAAGHSVETASKVYTHPLHESYDAMRRAVGE